MPERSVNSQLAELLANHGVCVTVGDEFIFADLPLSKLKLKARSIYEIYPNGVSSQLDVLAITEDGYNILESFGDIGIDIELAVNNNLKNFCSSTLHQLLAAFGSQNPETLYLVNFEEWKISEQNWAVFLGNIVPKASKSNLPGLMPTSEFYEGFEKAVRSQALSNKLHWFRAYYLQYKNKITQREFIMDNNDITPPEFLSDIPITPDVEYYSCRIFAILRQKQ